MQRIPLHVSEIHIPRYTWHANNVAPDSLWSDDGGRFTVLSVGRASCFMFDAFHTRRRGQAIPLFAADEAPVTMVIDSVKYELSFTPIPIFHLLVGLPFSRARDVASDLHLSVDDASEFQELPQIASRPLPARPTGSRIKSLEELATDPEEEMASQLSESEYEELIKKLDEVGLSDSSTTVQIWRLQRLS